MTAGRNWNALRYVCSKVEKALDTFSLTNTTHRRLKQCTKLTLGKPSVGLVIVVNEQKLAVAEVAQPRSTLLDFVHMTTTSTKPKGKRRFRQTTECGNAAGSALTLSDFVLMTITSTKSQIGKVRACTLRLTTQCDVNADRVVLQTSNICTQTLPQ